MTQLDTELKQAVARLAQIRAANPTLWSTFDTETASHFVDLARTLNVRGKRVLEIGSGHGFTCVLFALLGARSIAGIEVVESAAQFARNLARQADLLDRVEFTQASAADILPYPDSTFDVVLAIEVLSHVRAPVEDVLRECQRVIVPSGTLFVSDGNNACCARRRSQNQEIWTRFEEGPPTLDDETVHSHRIAQPYVESRCRIALAADPLVTEREATEIARRTFQFTEAEVRAAVAAYRSGGNLPESYFRPGECPIEPFSGMYIEQLLDPLAMRRFLRQIGFQEITLAPRRRLPLGPLWSLIPGATMRITNGFTLHAMKSAYQNAV